ncbi:MAG: alpha/beta hydrolase [Pseudomonadota bacterium]
MKILRHWRWPAIIVIAVVGSGLLYALVLERNHLKIHYFEDGIIQKAQSREVTRGSDTLAVVIHGYTASPMTMAPILDRLREDTDYDLWAPLLKYHGRTLSAFRAFDPAELVEDVRARLEGKAEGYDRLILIGHSLGGAVLYDLALRDALPEGAHLILLAPSIAIREDTPSNRWKIRAFRLFAPYCDFAFLGCHTPNPRSSDGNATVNPLPALYAQTIFFVTMMTPALTLFDYANTLWAEAERLDRPITIIMGNDDNSVPYETIKALCERLAACAFHTIEGASHLAMFGDKAGPYTALIANLAKGAGEPPSSPQAAPN